MFSWWKGYLGGTGLGCRSWGVISAAQLRPGPDAAIRNSKPVGFKPAEKMVEDLIQFNKGAGTKITSWRNQWFGV